MADARVNSIDELEVSRKTLIRLSENINQFFKEMSREVVNMQNNWDDTKYIEFRNEYVNTLNDVAKMEDTFVRYAEYLEHIIEYQRGYDNIRFK